MGLNSKVTDHRFPSTESSDEGLRFGGRWSTEMKNTGLGTFSWGSGSRGAGFI